MANNGNDPLFSRRRGVRTEHHISTHVTPFNVTPEMKLFQLFCDELEQVPPPAVKMLWVDDPDASPRIKDEFVADALHRHRFLPYGSTYIRYIIQFFITARIIYSISFICQIQKAAF